MRILTWNINSVRLRMPLLLRLIRQARPDAICLQETKCPVDKFPLKPLAEAGFKHAVTAGFKGYNGVALLSRTPISDPGVHHHVGREDARHVAGTVNGIEIHSLYVPAGGDIPDREENEKFAHKLDFVTELTDWFGGIAGQADRPAIVAGDFNIAPLETDVWSHRQLLNVVSHTPVEVEKLNAMQGAVPWVDAVRTLIPPEQTLYTWWSYRARDWRASNRGRRLDHIWVTPALRTSLQDVIVLDAARDWEKPSDHVPLILDLTDPEA